MNWEGSIRMNLQLFADSSSEKTEKATPRKKEKAREEGQVAKSTEITTALILVVMFSLFKLIGPWMIGRIILIFKQSFQLIGIKSLDLSVAGEIYMNFMGEGLLLMAPILGVTFMVAFLSNFAQVGWHPTLKPLKPKFNNLNPIQGFKRMFSFKTILELIKSILKILIILVIVFMTLRDYEELIYAFYDVGVFEAYSYIFEIISDVGVRIGMYFIAIAAIDYAYQKYKLSKDLRMSKEEIKQEYKMVDGNPEIKSRIRQKMREAAMRRMMQELPTADVIITNPTHFAVAIRYNENESRAPKVIAKGADLLAARIREKAKEYEIEIVENKPLARTLYYTVELNEDIPPELYQSVAEVLAFVYTLKNRS